MHSKRPGVKNRLFGFLSDDDFAEILDLLELVDLPKSAALSRLTRGTGTATSSNPGSPRFLFGQDGMTPSGLMIDAGLSPFQVIMQIPGKGYRIQSRMPARILRERPDFLVMLTRYAHTLAVQTA